MNVPIQEWYDAWLAEHKATNLIYAKGGEEKPSLDQVHFVRDRLAYLFWRGVKYEDIPKAPPPRDDCRDTVRIVGEHRSKSVRLPVFQMYRPDLDLKVIMRYNFHDWNVSVVSGHPITGLDLEGYGGVATADERKKHPSGLDGGVYWNYLFWQGFEPGMCFGPNADNPRRFSLAPNDHYELYAFMRELIAIASR